MIIIIDDYMISESDIPNYFGSCEGYGFLRKEHSSRGPLNLILKGVKLLCLKVFRTSKDLSENQLLVMLEICLILEFLGHFC